VENGAYVIRTVPTAVASVQLASWPSDKSTSKGRGPITAEGLLIPPADEAVNMGLAAEELLDLHLAPAQAVIVSANECDLVALPGEIIEIKTSAST
jgi:hypothetical protein